MTPLFDPFHALARVTAGSRVLVMAIVCLAYAIDRFRLDVARMGTVVVAQGLWYVLMGALMWRQQAQR